MRPPVRRHDAWSSQFGWPREISRPPTPLTPDWTAARESNRTLADLDPRTLAAGHGLPIGGRNLGGELRGFADEMPEPPGGSYAGAPAQYAADGSVAVVPPPVSDALARNLAIGVGVTVVAFGLLAAARRQPEARGLRHLQ